MDTCGSSSVTGREVGQLSHIRSVEDNYIESEWSDGGKAFFDTNLHSMPL